MIFPDLDVTLELDDLTIVRARDRWFGVEPYALPVFFKIDGERHRIQIALPGPGDGPPAGVRVIGPGAANEAGTVGQWLL